MNKLFILAVSLVLVFTVSFKVYASNSQGSGSQGSNSQKSDQIDGTTPQNGQGAQGNQGNTTQPVQNQNQVQTQNQGEAQQLQVQTQEQQGTGTETGTETGKGTNSNSGNADIQGGKKNLTQVRSSVAQQVQTLLGTQSAAGGMGDQVRQWARTQQQSETKIQEHLSKIESKTGLARSLFGPNYGSLNGLKQEMEQNKVRVQQLEQLKLKLTNEGDITNVQEMITLLQQENTTLQEKITSEESNGGLLGWLVKLFAK